MKGKTLIAYFSAEGTTAAVADILAKRCMRICLRSGRPRRIRRRI